MQLLEAPGISVCRCVLAALRICTLAKVSHVSCDYQGCFATAPQHLQHVSTTLLIAPLCL